jgi:hypothetical protein
MAMTQARFSTMNTARIFWYITLIEMKKGRIFLQKNDYCFVFYSLICIFAGKK